MKKLLIYLILLCLWAPLCWAADEPFNLRGVVLDMPVNEVLKLEDGKPFVYKPGDQTAFVDLNENVFGLKAQQARYYLTPEGLVFSVYLDFGKYEFRDPAILADYQKLAAGLEALYGTPMFYGSMKTGEIIQINVEDLGDLLDEMVLCRAMWYKDDACMSANLVNVGGSKQKHIYILYNYNE